MSNSWHKTQNDEEAEKHASDFWSRHRAELEAGEFWADRIKKLRGEPVKRLKLALENLPLPASFREAAIATRALIREKRKAKNNYDEELALLYWLAAINSFSIPYSTVLQEPGYNVIESLPGEKLKSLPFSYHELGYEKLELLKKTDIKWLIELWGEPTAHITLHEMHIDVWRQYETKLKNKRNRREEEFISELKSLGTTAQISPKKKNSKKWLIWFVVGVIIIGILILGKD
ncbi:MAG: hypothetical protein KAW47_03760 [Thermoplasmatales archaeon]|nr:hypothetical protein [Thermoplasmatales archaeon]